MRVSVVISTLNRAESLDKTIQSLRLQTYDDVELVVVNGPSTDATEAVLDSLDLPFKRLRCPLANLSMSRNIGIRAAAGELLAFLDDDALPEPTWLEEIVAAFDDPEIGGVGGLVFDNSGLTLQYAYSWADRFGRAGASDDQPFDDWSFPGSWQYPYLQGTNAVFRAEAMARIGLFDEEYEYFLDETDVCLRMVDAGYRLRQLPGAAVHHKFLPSEVRNEHRVVKYWFPVIKNRTYFGLKHARPERSVADVCADVVGFMGDCLNDVRFHTAAGRLPSDEPERAGRLMHEAFEAGLRRGLAREPGGNPPVVLDPPPFVAFPTAGRRPGRMCVVLVSRDYPPEGVGGVATLTAAAATGLADAGHEVRVVTRASGIGRVDLEGNVWVHRVCDDDDGQVAIGPVSMPAHVAARMRAVEVEVCRIGRVRPVDVVYGPIWDSETLTLAGGSTFPLVTHIETTMGLALRTRDDWPNNPEFMRVIATPLLAAERELLHRSAAVHAISAAIAGTVSADHELGDVPVSVVPIAIPSVAAGGDVAAPELPAGVSTRVLFVGRLEPRKGLDALLDAVAELVRRRPAVVVELVGDDTIPLEDGSTYRSRFEAAHRDDPASARVRFHGRIDDAALAAMYGAADVFVAPSRYESFGLVFLEAMHRSVAVVGTRVGGVPEIVLDGETGLLVPPDDPEALTAALTRLVDDETLRARLGAAGRARLDSVLSLDAYITGLAAALARVRWMRLGCPEVSILGPKETRVMIDGTEGVELAAGTAVDVVFAPSSGRSTLLCSATAARVVRVTTPTSSCEVTIHGGGIRRMDLPAGMLQDGRLTISAEPVDGDAEPPIFCALQWFDGGEQR